MKSKILLSLLFLATDYLSANNMFNSYNFSNKITDSSLEFSWKVTTQNVSPFFFKHENCMVSQTNFNIPLNIEKMQIQIINDKDESKNSSMLVFHSNGLLGSDPMDKEYVQNNNSNIAQIAFMDNEGNKLSINTVPFNDAFVEIPLYVKAGDPGEYRIRFYDMKNLSNGRCISLVDTENGQVYSVRESEFVSVSLDANTPTDRFKLVIGEPLKANKQNDISCFGQKDGQINVSWLSSTSDSYDLFLNKELILSGLNESKTIKQLPKGVYNLKPSLESGYCKGSFVRVEILEPKELIADMICPKETTVGEEVKLYSKSLGAGSYDWNFGDGVISKNQNPMHTYDKKGTYTLTLTATSPNGLCTNEISKEIHVQANFTNNMDEEASRTPYQILPSDKGVVFTWNNESTESIELNLQTVTGKLVAQYNIAPSEFDKKEIPTNELSKGIYLLQINAGRKHYSEKIYK